MRRAALLHDVGKLAISNRILDKPARLTRRGVRGRAPPSAAHGVDPRAHAGLRRLAPLAGAHHERLDGSGYPHGLDGGALTLPMRVLAVADVYEALTSARPYRPAKSSAEALEVMRPDVPRAWTATPSARSRPCSRSAAPRPRPPRRRSTTPSAPRPSWVAAPAAG